MTYRSECYAGGDAEKAPKKEPKIPASMKDLTDEDRACMVRLATRYRDFINTCRTPHESIMTAVQLVKGKGIPEFTSDIGFENGFYMHDQDYRQFALVLPGSAQADEVGINILGAHMDAPCFNVCASAPIEEQPEGVVLAVKPYGGIWPHQWLDSQVLVKGIVPFKNSSPRCFELTGTISDRGVHVARAKVAGQRVSDAFPHEMFKVILGYASKDDLLDATGIHEDDFFRGTWWVVPKESPTLLAGNLIAGYGHDDRICFFTELMAALGTSERKYPLVVYGCSREEIGSTGIDGAQGAFIDTVTDNLLRVMGYPYTKITDAVKRQMYAKSLMISSDVDIAYTGMDAQYQTKERAAKLGDGIVLVKANGGAYQSSGNYASDAVASTILDIYKEGKVATQMTELPSKLENGGGGTIARYFAERGIPVIDSGPPIANMHGKNPIAHIGDLYQTYKAYCAFIGR